MRRFPDPFFDFCYLRNRRRGLRGLRLGRRFRDGFRGDDPAPVGAHEPGQGFADHDLVPAGHRVDVFERNALFQPANDFAARLWRAADIDVALHRFDRHNRIRRTHDRQKH